MGHLLSNLGSELLHSAGTPSEQVTYWQVFLFGLCRRNHGKFKKGIEFFRKECLKTMECNLMLSLKLAFQMLRNANNIYHRKAIDNRYYIAFNEI